MKIRLIDGAPLCLSRRDFFYGCFLQIVVYIYCLDLKTIKLARQ